ncbi:MAG: hypothetical protein FWD71_11740 [Oscillospiraceae bacterium]|nr:hypothetical protein [Oscillospiraceae bacterium]
MAYYITGLCIYGIFDFIELLGNSKVREKILFVLIFAIALILGIWYFSAYVKPNFTRGLIDYFGMKNIDY